MDKSNESFRELLDNSNTYPTLYLFKFIVPNGKLEEVYTIFPNQQVSEKPSKTGKYVSTSIKMKVSSTDEIMALYTRAAKIEGIISL